MSFGRGLPPPSHDEWLHRLSGEDDPDEDDDDDDEGMEAPCSDPEADLADQHGPEIRPHNGGQQVSESTHYQIPKSQVVICHRDPDYWAKDWQNVRALAQWLVAENYVKDCRELLRYFERPWCWDDEWLLYQCAEKE